MHTSGTVSDPTAAGRLLGMVKDKDESRERARTRGGLIRKVSYLYDDEAGAIEIEADRKKCSESEVIRRAIRAYLKL